jgi:hypothetical protein
MIFLNLIFTIVAGKIIVFVQRFVESIFYLAILMSTKKRFQQNAKQIPDLNKKMYFYSKNFSLMVVYFFPFFFFFLSPDGWF